LTGALGAVAVSQHRSYRKREQAYLSRISLLEQQNKELAHRASHDELTGLLNKPAWKEEIKEKIRLGKAFGIFFIDIEGFKKVNDECGHEVGDVLLQMCSQVLSSIFRREGDIVTHERLFGKEKDGQLEGSAGRYGGDEFGVIVSLSGENGDRTKDPEGQMKNTLGYVTSILDEFSDELLSTISIPKIGFSIGSAIWSPEDPLDPSALVHKADEAMYRNKEAHKAEQLIT